MKIGDKVVFIPASCIVVRQSIDHSYRMEGTVVRVNLPHGWFLVEYQASGVLLREGFRFDDVGHVIVKKGGKHDESKIETFVAHDAQ